VCDEDVEASLMRFREGGRLYVLFWSEGSVMVVGISKKNCVS
jgi:hypothetical protein